eukprot:TRINITY_DN661_c0_g1_i2.p1 TRINITY_DN661_c0_g1~~TRINITY_DN661_c0_g1_i2.p1  ORF type:complete len:144 (+),score=26.80 TRINITY_DN661_c0_g1_i2:63-494(+)
MSTSRRKQQQEQEKRARLDSELEIMRIVDSIKDYGISKEPSVTGDFETFPPRGSNVTIHYIATTEEGDEWDNTYTRDVPFTFESQTDDVWPGLDVAVASMSLGERSTFHIPHRMAFGKQGFAGKVPPRMDVYMDIQLLDIEEV